MELSDRSLRRDRRDSVACTIMDVTHQPILAGIVNLTVDSFSDGGQFLDVQRAVDHARLLMQDGAAILDIGPASSHPDAAQVPADEQIRRVSAVLSHLQDVADIRQGRVLLSLDSPDPAVQEWALAQGFAMLNDISGFAQSPNLDVIASSQARLVVMHSLQQGQADRRSGVDDIVDTICRFWELRLQVLQRAGIDLDRILLDPGAGYFLGTDPMDTVRALRGIPQFQRRFGLPLYISVSRKSFLGALTGRGVAERGAATLAAELYAVHAGAAVVRTHDVRALRDALRVSAALAG